MQRDAGQRRRSLPPGGRLTMRLIDYFDRGADLYPDRHCLHDGTRGWTYATCAPDPSRRQRPAGGGPEARLKVAVYSPNHAAAYACLLGIVRAGRHLGAGQCAQCARGEPLHPRQHRRGVPVLPFELRGLAGAHPRGLPQDPRLRLPRPAVVRRLAGATGGDGARPARRSRRRGVPGELGRHDRPAQGRADHQPQHRDHELDLLGLHAGRARRRSI